MQTISNKQKYKWQQLFKILSLSLDTCLDSGVVFSIGMGPVNDGQLEDKLDLNH